MIEFNVRFELQIGRLRCAISQKMKKIWEKDDSGQAGCLISNRMSFRKQLGKRISEKDNPFFRILHKSGHGRMPNSIRQKETKKKNPTKTPREQIETPVQIVLRKAYYGRYNIIGGGYYTIRITPPYLHILCQWSYPVGTRPRAHWIGPLTWGMYTRLFNINRRGYLN